MLISIVNASNVNDNKTDDSIENNENIISDSNPAIDDNVKENTSKNNVFDSNLSYGANTFETTLNLTK